MAGEIPTVPCQQRRDASPRVMPEGVSYGREAAALDLRMRWEVRPSAAEYKSVPFEALNQHG